MGRVNRRIAVRTGAAALLGLAGCAGVSQELSGRLSQLVTPTPVENPLLIPAADFEAVWSTTVKVVDEYFDIASENRLARKIVTQPKIGATLIEPWEGDSTGFRERLEASLQTIRRHAEVTVTGAPGGGYQVQVMVIKELEDLVKPDRQQAGRAVFNNDFPVNRSREIVGPFPAPAQWIYRGRDSQLESKILGRIREALFL